MFTHESHRGAGGFVGRQIVKASLFLTQIGACLFFAGSYEYQGSLAKCETGTRPRLAVDQGTLQFVLGSTCYLVQSLLSLARTIRLHGVEDTTKRAGPLTEASSLITELVAGKPGPFAS